MRDSNAAIKHFVQEVLGCGCPDEVFDDIDHIESPRNLFGIPCGHRILIGRRLLILLLETDDIESVISRLPDFVVAGLRERDQLELNRCRIVIATNRKEAAEALIKAAFDRIPERDERLHLHIVDRQSIGFLDHA